MRALHRVEIQRLRRQLNQYKRSTGNGLETGKIQVIIVIQEIEVDGTIAGLDGIEPSGIDLLNLKVLALFQMYHRVALLWRRCSGRSDVRSSERSLFSYAIYYLEHRKQLRRGKAKVEVKLATAIRNESAKRQARAWACIYVLESHQQCLQKLSSLLLLFLQSR